MLECDEEAVVAMLAVDVEGGQARQFYICFLI